ncbi:CocE/NonD family hydrolase [Mameliella sp.]|uniref:CocE/NonD family hydrolase n=1 Tax=Mameliella sp. TaxID=1924940 RepID=UPI003B5041B7
MRDMVDSPLRPLLPVQAPVRQELRLKDGTLLVADTWRPDTQDTLPVLLMRQPYGRAIASTVTLAHPAWYAARGYVVTVQDVRGTGDSEGDFDALVNEAEDGAETLDWARDLPGSNGKVGTYGFSYQGTTQFLMLAGGVRPDAMAVSMASWSPLTDWLSEGGLFRCRMSASWAAQMARLKARRMGDSAALAALAPERGWQAHFDFLMTRPDLSHLSRWAKGEPGADPAADLAPPLAVPLIQTAGTADFFLRGTLAADRAFRAVSPDSTHLVLGPWGHIGWNRSAGAARLASGAEFSVDRAQLAFFDHYLKGRGPRPAAITAYDAGTDSWHDTDTLEGTGSRVYHLASDGLAAQMVTDGRLTTAPATPGSDMLVLDPTRQAPLCGGAFSGPVDLGPLHDRSDVACYTTAPMAGCVQLRDRVEAEIALDVDGPHPGLAATLAEVDRNGTATALATTVTRLKSGTLRLVFEGLFHSLRPGHSLRLSLQAAPLPDFQPYPATELADPGLRATTIAIDHRASRLFVFTADQEPPHA